MCQRSFDLNHSHFSLQSIVPLIKTLEYYVRNESACGARVAVLQRYPSYSCQTRGTGNTSGERDGTSDGERDGMRGGLTNSRQPPLDGSLTSSAAAHATKAAAHYRVRRKVSNLTVGAAYRWRRHRRLTRGKGRARP